MALSKETAFLSVAELQAGLKEQRWTSVQLTEFFLDRLEQQGSKYNAVVTITRELALNEAKQADAERADGRVRGPLHGIPYGAKDLLAVPGYPTTWGAEPLRKQSIEELATVIRRLREAGAVLVAKLAMIELAGGFGYRQGNASFTGPVKNPWDLSRWAGGSSSGSGAAVAAGLVPFAIGSETWGSIATPASYCGLSALRPTYGRVSKAGAMTLSWTMDKIGPLTRTVADAEAVFAAIAGFDPEDDSTVDRPWKPYEPMDGKRLRIGKLKDPRQKLQPEIKQNLDAVFERLSKSCEIVDLELPDLPFGTVASVIIDCEGAAAFDDFVQSGKHWELTAPEDRPGALAAMLIPAKDYLNALRLRKRMQRELDVNLKSVDAVLDATTATVSCPLDQDFGQYQAGFAGSALGAASNVAGLPAIFLQSGRGEAGLPTSCQLVGRAFSDELLLSLGRRLQSETDWHRAQPAVD